MIPAPFLIGEAFLQKCGPIPAPVIVPFCSAHQSSPHPHGRRGFSANTVGRSDAAGTPPPGLRAVLDCGSSSAEAVTVTSAGLAGGDRFEPSVPTRGMCEVICAARCFAVN